MNQHYSLADGAWQSDPDKSSGANIDRVQYCKKWWPLTKSVRSIGVAEAISFCNGGQDPSACSIVSKESHDVYECVGNITVAVSKDTCRGQANPGIIKNCNAGCGHYQTCSQHCVSPLPSLLLPSPSPLLPSPSPSILPSPPPSPSGIQLLPSPSPSDIQSPSPDFGANGDFELPLPPVTPSPSGSGSLNTTLPVTPSPSGSGSINTTLPEDIASAPLSPSPVGLSFEHVQNLDDAFSYLIFFLVAVAVIFAACIGSCCYFCSKCGKRGPSRKRMRILQRELARGNMKIVPMNDAPMNTVPVVMTPVAVVPVAAVSSAPASIASWGTSPSTLNSSSNLSLDSNPDKMWYQDNSNSSEAQAPSRASVNQILLQHDHAVAHEHEEELAHRLALEARVAQRRHMQVHTPQDLVNWGQTDHTSSGRERVIVA